MSNEVGTPELNAIQDTYFRLLSELDDICSDANIPYFLSNRAALHGYVDGDLPPADYSPSILVKVEDCYRLIDAIEMYKPSSRFLESMLCNDNYPSFTLRYGDINSLCLSVRQRDNFQEHGIHVIIGFIEHTPGPIMRRLGTLMKSGWYENNCPYARGSSINKDVRFSSMIMKPFMMANRMGTGRFVFNRLVSLYSKAGSKYQLNQSNMRKRTLKQLWVESDPSYIEIRGRQFPSFSDTAGYLRMMYGPRYEAQAHAQSEESIYRIIDASISFAEFKEANLDLFSSSEFIDLIEENNELNKLNAPFNRRITEEWKIARYVEQKMVLTEQYKHEHVRLENLLQSEAYDELYDTVLPYIRHALRNTEGIDPFYDKDLYGVCEAALVAVGNKQLLGRFRAVKKKLEQGTKQVDSSKGKKEARDELCTMSTRI